MQENQRQPSRSLLHLLSQRPDSTGSGISIQAMINGAAGDGHRNCLVAGIEHDRPASVAGLGEADHRFVRFGTDIGFPIVGMSDVMPYASSRFRDLSPTQIEAYEGAFARTLEEAVRHCRPDLIHSHHLWLLSSLARRLFPELPLVVTCHGSDLRQFRSCPHLRERVLAGCQGIDAVLALSEVQKREIVRLYGLAEDRVHVVGAGFDDRCFRSGIKRRPEPVRIIYAGKLSRAKGVPWLLQALAGISRPAWHLDLVGGGSGREAEECRQLAAALGSRVEAHGAVDQDRLASLMREAHLFVLPSLFEGLPLVLLEALASGCRLVATELPGVLELCGIMATDCIRLIPTPRLREVDLPEEADLPGFIETLRSAVHAQLSAAVRQPQPDLAAIEPQIAAFSWTGVHARVRAVYATLW